MATTSVIFPNIINVVLNDTLSAFISGTTVSPAVAGSFTFRKTNSSGAVLTSSSVFDASGNYTIFCTFTPTSSDAVSASYTVFVQDKDVWNNYFNVPVTDTTNMLVNGNFNYLPATIPSGTSTTTASQLVNVPGWMITSYGNLRTVIYNNVNDPSLGSFPYPFGTNYIRLRYYTQQMFYAVAGTYTLSFYAGVRALVVGTDYGYVSVDTTRISNINNSPQLQPGWQLYTFNFTVTTGMHRLWFHYSGGSSFFIGGVSIKPVSTPVYLRFSKINSLISNGIFETEVNPANSKSLTPINQWDVVNNNVWVLNNYSAYTTGLPTGIPTPYPSGNQCIAIEALGKVTQTFTATAGTSNFLSFYACAVCDSSVNRIRAAVNGTSVFDSSGIFYQNTWTKYIFSGITTVDGTNTLTFEGLIPSTDWIVAIDNVILGSVTKETPVVSFGPKTDYQFIPIQNNTVNSNTFTASGNNAHNGVYEFTASSNWVFTSSNIYYLADNDPTTFYHTSGSGTNFYYRAPYASNGTYQGGTDINGNLAYYWTTNIVGVGTVSGEWVQYKLPHPIQLTKYGLLGRNGLPLRFPLDYFVLGSVDGKTWYSINSVTNSTIPTWPNTQFVDVSNNTKLFNYYRLVCSRLGVNGGVLNFATFSLFGDNTKNYYGTPLGANLNATFNDISGAYTYFLDAGLTNQVYPTTTLPIGNYTIYNRYISADTVDYTTAFTNASLSVIAPPSSIVFPSKTINVVYNDTLAAFIAGTSVSPSVPGTFTFFKTNSSGAILTASSVFDTVGNYTIFVSFAPDDYVNNSPCSASYTVAVQDQDAYNNYYNIPVTDLSNVLVNGNFDFTQYASGTQTGNATIPGWKFPYAGTSYLYKSYNFSAGATFPPPFGTNVIRLNNTSLFQVFYAIAGTYTFSMTYANLTSLPNAYLRFNLDSVQIYTQYAGTINDWTNLTFTFTIATTGMHMWGIYGSSNIQAYFGNCKIVPVSVLNNVSYLKFSKINSQIFNGTFESEITLPSSRTLTPLTNWSSTNNNVWVLNNFQAITQYTALPLPYPSGNQCVSIEGTGKISQTFNHIDSSFNYLSFYLGLPSYFDSSINPIVVKINNTTIATAGTVSSYISGKCWFKYIFTNITTVAGANTLSIEGTDTSTNSGKLIAIDNVIFGSMNMIPTSASHAPPATIKYGTPLAPLLNATCSVPANFKYYLDAAYTNQIFADSTLPTGTYSIYVVAIPLDIYLYLNSFAGPATVTVVDPNPSIVFPKVINVVLNDTLTAFINYTTVTPSVPGTFAFTNSNGDILTTSSIYNAVGKFTINCTFTPADTATYETTSATYSITVEDNDSPNNYFNIPVTDTTNLLVNGNFEYVPSTYPPGTSTSNQASATPTNIPGWRFGSIHTTNYSQFINNVSVSALVSYPFPNGPKCAALRGGNISQTVFLNAGTYTFSMWVARSSIQTINSFFVVWIDSTNIGLWNQTTMGGMSNWIQVFKNFTVSTTKTYTLQITSAGSPIFYVQKMSIMPIYPNPQYLKFSKIDSQIFNGSFETEIKTANSSAVVPLKNWTVNTSTVRVLNNFSSYGAIPLPYPSGNQCIAIERLGKISQTFTYTASTLNYLSFYVCGDASSNPLKISLNGTTVWTFNILTGNYRFNNLASFGGTWQKCIYPFLTTVDGENTLSFEGTEDKAGYIGIDNVIFGQVNRALPTVTFPTPSPIVYGTDLSFVLVAYASEPGSFSYYTDASYSAQVFSNTILTPKQYTIYSVFKPPDQVNFMQAFANIDLSVNRITPSLVFPTLPSIDYGTQLESSLIATTNVPGKIDYYLDANRTLPVNTFTALTPGTYTIYAVLTPTDTFSYSQFSLSQTLTVNSAPIITPIMYYPVPTSIASGTDLTNKLNASIIPNVSGTIRYYTDANSTNEVTTYTKLSAGFWTIHAVFTPLDASTCNPTSKTVPLLVSNISVDSRKLILNTKDILASNNTSDYFNVTVSNTVGMVENSRYTYTWFTNIRNVMGDEFYNKYSRFSIRLKEFVNDTTGESPMSSVFYEVYNECKLSGIYFDPPLYENGVAVSQATMCVLARKFPACGYYNVQDGCNSTYTFSKISDTIPIKIDLPNLYDNQYFAPSADAISFGHFSFVFEIHGVL